MTSPAGSSNGTGERAGNDQPGDAREPVGGGDPGRRLVVLDIDDTLYLERDYVRSGFEAVGVWARDELGVDDLGERAWTAFEAGVRRTIFDDALAGAGVEAADGLVPQLVQVYRAHAPTIEMLADARAWLDGLAPHVALAVVTDGPLASQQAKAEALRLTRWADLVVFTESLGPGMGKPHPAAFEQLERELGLSGDRCAYVADNPAKDFVAPHRLGWRTVRVRRPGGLHADVPSGDDVDAEITSLDELDAALAWDPPPPASTSTAASPTAATRTAEDRSTVGPTAEDRPGGSPADGSPATTGGTPAPEAPRTHAPTAPSPADGPDSQGQGDGQVRRPAAPGGPPHDRRLQPAVPAVPAADRRARPGR